MSRYIKQVVKIVLVALLSFGAFLSYGQQTFSLTSMYNHSLYNINPAAVGSSGCFEANIQHKTQWSKLAGKPTNYLLQAQWGLGEQSGLGINLNSWQAGLLQNTNFGLSYAYHIPVTDKARLSIGLTANVSNQKVAATSAIVSNNGDNLLSGGNLSTTGVIFDGGILFSTSKLNIGIASPQLVSSNLSYTALVGNNGFNNERMYNAHLSYQFTISEKVSYAPTVLFRTIPKSSSLIDLNNRILFNETVGLGIGYRSNNTLFGSLDLLLNDQLKVAYVFDAFSGSNRIGGLSHELLLGVKLCKKEKPYSVNIQQADSSYASNAFSDMVEVGSFVKETKDKDEALANRIQNELDQNPGAMEYNVPLPKPTYVTLEGEKFKFKTLKEMDEFLEFSKDEDPDLYVRLKDQIDKSGIRSSQLEEGKSFEINIEDDKMQFSELKKVDEYALSLDQTNPALKDKIIKAREADPTKKNLEIGLSSQAEISAMMLASKPKPEPKKEVVEPKEEEKVEEVKEESFDLGSAIVYFEFNKSTMRKPYKSGVDQLIQELKENPELKVVIVGHSCDLGSNNVIQNISRKRANIVRAYIMKNGISADRLSVEFKGDKLPLVPNNSSTNREKNRRVDYRWGK